MHARPIFLARPNRLGGLAPIYSAIVALVAVSLIAFAIVLWPVNSKQCESPQVPEAAPVARTLGGSPSEPSEAVAPRARGRWM